MDKDVSSFSVITSKRNKFFNTAIPAFLISITTMVAPTINAQENPHLPNGWSIEQSTDIRQRALAILEKVDPWYEPSLFEDLVSLGKDVVPFLGEVVNKEVVDDRQIMVCQFSMGALVKIGGGSY